MILFKLRLLNTSQHFHFPASQNGKRHLMWLVTVVWASLKKKLNLKAIGYMSLNNGKNWTDNGRWAFFKGIYTVRKGHGY
jgi:hypothetical protein